jgi:hypothetical protein
LPDLPGRLAWLLPVKFSEQLTCLHHMPTRVRCKSCRQVQAARADATGTRPMDDQRRPGGEQIRYGSFSGFDHDHGPVRESSLLIASSVQPALHSTIDAR